MCEFSPWERKRTCEVASGWFETGWGGFSGPERTFSPRRSTRENLCTFLASHGSRETVRRRQIERERERACPKAPSICPFSHIIQQVESTLVFGAKCAKFGDSNRITKLRLTVHENEHTLIKIAIMSPVSWSEHARKWLGCPHRPTGLLRSHFPKFYGQWIPDGPPGSLPWVSALHSFHYIADTIPKSDIKIDGAHKEPSASFVSL